MPSVPKLEQGYFCYSNREFYLTKIFTTITIIEISPCREIFTLYLLMFTFAILIFEREIYHENL